jgi:myo-inositol 2-dehydrogenase/D-chiro-inositol 1-dehydrogenase
MEDSTRDINRRRFMGATAAAMFIRPELVRGTAANSAIRLGLIGCGGRGTTVATSFATHTNTRVVALADVFQDQMDKAHAAFGKIAEEKGYAGIDRKQMFLGPKAFQELANSKEIDMVQVSSPGYFHTEHLDAAVTAGKHVYCEKPVGVDVASCKRAQRIGEKAQGKLSLEVGFQIRCAPPFVAMVDRIHAGAIGKIGNISAHYHATSIEYPPRPNASKNELRLRNWYWDKVLSGDIVVDQNIHVLDVCNWVLKAHPVKAEGTYGRNLRKDFGNCADHFSLVFQYPENVHLTFDSIQYGKKFWDVSERFFGEKGVAESPYSGPVHILSDEPWEWKGEPPSGGSSSGFSTTGEFHDNLEQADAEKEKSFIDSIVSGKFHNQAATGAESALTAILGRTAAYTGKPVTWDELMRSNHAYEPPVDLNKLG